MRSNLIAARARCGLSQQALAAAVGLSQSHLSKIERGAASIRGDVLLALARELGITPEEALAVTAPTSAEAPTEKAA